MGEPAQITLSDLTSFRPLDARSGVSIEPAGYEGARVEVDDLQILDDHPAAPVLRIRGIDQATFEVLVDRYGERFTGLALWNCPNIDDLTPLETLPQLTHVAIYRNLRTARLWDIAKTPNVTGLHLTDFRHLHSLDDLAKATFLEELELGDMISKPKVVVESLEPLAHLEALISLRLVVLRVDDDRVQPLGALRRLRRLRSPLNLWTTEQCAWLRAHLPEEAEGPVLEPVAQTRTSAGPRDTRVIGRRKPWLNSAEDSERIARYVADYWALVDRYRNDPTVDPVS